MAWAAAAVISMLFLLFVHSPQASEGVVCLLPEELVPGCLLPGLSVRGHLRPELLVVREGDELRGPIRLDGQVDHADRLGGPSALLDAELVGPRHAVQDLPHFLLLPLLVAEVALERRLRTVRPEGQQLGGDGFAYLPALLVEDVELRDVVDVPLDADMLADVVTKLVVRVEGAELVDPLVRHAGGVGLHEQHRRILAGRSCLLIALAVLKEGDRRDPLLARVLEAPVLPGVVLLVLPLRPRLEELLHRQQLAALEHTVDVLLPFGVGLGAGEGARVALEPFRELGAHGREEALDRLVPRLIRERPPDLLNADALVEAHGLGVELEVDVPLLAALAGHGLRRVVLAVVDVEDVGDAARVGVEHLDEALLEGLVVGVHTSHVAHDRPAPHVHPCDELRADGLDLPVRGDPLNPKVEGVLVADDVLHDLEARRVALALEHLLVLPLPGAVGREVAGRLSAPAVHEVLDVPGDRLDAGVVLPAPALGDLLELLVEHFDRSQVGREAPVEPYILNERLLLIRETREGGGRLRLPTQGQRPEIVPALAVLLLHLEGPGVRLEDVVDVAVEGRETHSQAQRVPLGVGRAVGAVVVDEVLHPRRQLDGLVERLLVLLGVVVEVDAHIPGRGLCSLLYDDIPPVYLLCRPPRLPALGCEGVDGDEHLLLAAVLLGLRSGLVLLGVAGYALGESSVLDALELRRLLHGDEYVRHSCPSLPGVTLPLPSRPSGGRG